MKVSFRLVNQLSFENWIGLKMKGIMAMEDYIDEFLIYMKQMKRASWNTLVSYRRDLNKLVFYLQRCQIVEPQRINETVLNSYILSLEKEGFSAATVSRSIASIKAFTLYMVKNGILCFDPTQCLQAPKVNRKKPVFLTEEEIYILLQQTQGNKPRNLRDRAILELFYATGIKVTELVQLKLEDIYLMGGFLKCNTERERMVPFGVKAKEALRIYLEQGRSQLLKKQEDKHILFLTRSGKKFTRQGIWKLLRKYSEAAGIKKEMTPQILRNSFAIHLMNRGADIRMVSEMLGHSDVSITKYYRENQNQEEKIMDVYQSCHPRA